MRISDWSSDVCSSDLAKGLPTTVADLRFAKPLDEKLIRKLLTTHEVAVTIEEGSIGGLGAHVLTLASDCGLIDAGLKLRTLRLPDIFQDQDKHEKQYADDGRDGDGLVATVLKAFRYHDSGVIAGARYGNLPAQTNQIAFSSAVK